jgi:hypothetical protein
MLVLLAEAPGPGYPGDYLCARLQGRRGRLGDISGPEASAGGDDRRYWQEAAAERAWLFRQMDAGVRAALAPLFVYFELGSMAQALRHQTVGRSGEAERLLGDGMLALWLRAILAGQAGVREVLGNLERSLAGRELGLAGISKRYGEGGLQRCEELLRSRFLARALAVTRQEDLVFFFRALVDMRNLLAMAKWLRWRPSTAPVLVPGGQAALPGSIEKVTEAGLARMVRSWTHNQGSTGDRLRPELLEPLLQAHLLNRLAGRRRVGGVAAACIEYLWRGHVAARASGLRLHTAGEVAQ